MGSTRIGDEKGSHISVLQKRDLSEYSSDYIEDMIPIIEIITPEDSLRCTPSDLFELLESIGKESKSLTKMRVVIKKFKKYLRELY